MEKDLMDEIENLAMCQFTTEEIKLITGIDEIDKNIILKGRLKADAQVRLSVYTQAKNGSAPAQKEY